MLRPFALAFALLLPAAAQVKILTIGDSLTDEYGAITDLASFITIDSVYPEPDPPNPDDNPRAFNWPEILELKRSTEADFGTFGEWGGLTFLFDVIPVPFGDLRYKGFEYNFAVASTTSTDWVDLLTGNSSSNGFPLAGVFFPNTRNALFDALPEVDVVVIFLGGNDLKNEYNDLFNDNEPATYYDDLQTRLDTIHGIIRGRRADVPIIVATVPDVGATPNVFETYNIPAQQVTTRAKIEALNQSIISHFSAKPATGVARVDRLTSDILDIILGIEPAPYDLNGTPFVIGGDPYNSPEYLFCKDEFHPNTVAQSLIANEIIEAINQFYPDAVTPLSNREILEELLFLDPDQPYLDWVAGFALALDGPDDDPDRDGLPNLVEMILGTPPNAFSTPFTGSWPDGVSWTPADESYATLAAEESPDLSGWTPVPPARLSVNGSQITATPPAGADRQFLRLEATPRP